MPTEERGPDLRQVSEVTKPRGLAKGLSTPLVRVQRLQTSLQVEAKAEPALRLPLRSERREGCDRSGVSATIGRSPCRTGLVRRSGQAGTGYCHISGRVSL
jgi:hypothetical protein